MAMNRITFTGNLTRDPEMREVGGASCLNFTVASDSHTKNADGSYITNFYSCTAWRQAAETIAKYMHKGNKILISGDLCIRPYKDAQGNDRQSISVTVGEFEFLSSRNNDSESAPAQNRGVPAGYQRVTNDTSLPF